MLLFLCLFRMSSSVFGRVFSSTLNSVFKRFAISLIRVTLIYFIALFFVQLPSLWSQLLSMGENEEKRDRQKRSRARLVQPTDPNSPYRAMEVIQQLENQPEEEFNTLADIPQLCLQRFPQKLTLGTREILDVQDEKQPSGKVFKKVSFSRFQKKKENLLSSV